MPEPKYLWRVGIRRVAHPIYLVAQNVQSAAAQATAHPQVALADLQHIQRIDSWDDSQHMTVVTWPEPPHPPQPDEPTPP